MKDQEIVVLELFRSMDAKTQDAVIKMLDALAQRFPQDSLQPS